MIHLIECDMSLCYVEQDKECKGTLSCMRANCNQFCICQKLRACERRVEAGWQIIADNNYRLGVQDGREAVARMWDADKETSLGRSIAAYDRGYEDAKKIFEVPTGVWNEESYDSGYWKGYEQGYDSALSHHVCETGFVEAPESGFDWPTNFNQHGTGENP